MAGHGGYRPGAGRKKGGHNRLTDEAVQKAAEGGLMPLDYLLSLMRSEDQPQETRLDAAKAAAPYLHARLASIEVSGETEVRHTVMPTLPTSEEWEAEHATEH